MFLHVYPILCHLQVFNKLHGLTLEILGKSSVGFSKNVAFCMRFEQK
jgi:hypothetical protein